MHAHPGTTVVTVLAGAPNSPHTGYNSRTTGATHAPDALKIRKDEDSAALSSLSAGFVWLDFLDNDYADGADDINDVVDIRRALEDVIASRRPATVVSPLGLVHVDHVRVSDVCLDVALRCDIDWYLYTDLPYAAAMPRTVPQRVGELTTRVALGAPLLVPGDPVRKRATMKIYRSQFEPTRRSGRRGFRIAMKAPEEFRRVERARDEGA